MQNAGCGVGQGVWCNCGMQICKWCKQTTYFQVKPQAHDRSHSHSNHSKYFCFKKFGPIKMSYPGYVKGLVKFNAVCPSYFYPQNSVHTSEFISLSLVRYVI